MKRPVSGSYSLPPRSSRPVSGFESGRRDANGRGGRPPTVRPLLIRALVQDQIVASSVEHEDGLACFITPERRRRFREQLASPKSRTKLLRGLAHFRHLDHRFAIPVPTQDQQSSVLGTALRARGACGTCYLVSEDRELDGLEMTLDDVLAQLVDEGSFSATFVSCVPGRLGYFHDEEPENRYILERPK